MVNPTVKQTALLIVRNVVIYSLCAFYSSLVALYVLWMFITKRHTRFWVPKEHEKPAALSDPRYGEHKYITVNGVKLHCVINGPENAPLMLFVHGFPEFWYSWRYQIVEFSRDYRTVAIDLRGYGDSEKPAGQQPYRVPTLVADLRALITALGYERCTLVCHDWGAIIGWQFVQQHMDVIDKYVMMGSPSSSVWRHNLMSSPEQFLKSWYVMYLQMPWLPEYVASLHDYRVLKTIGAGGSEKGIAKEDLEAYKYTFSRPGAFTPPINYYRANLRVFAGLPQPKVEKYAPGLFLLGEKDMYISQKTGPQQQRRNANLRFECVRDANHFVQQDAPEAVNKLMREFLKA